MGRIVRRAWGESQMTEERKRELAELAKRPDSEIDLSEMPELTEEFWQNAIPNPFYRPMKKQVTVRIDADVLEWLRRQGGDGVPVPAECGFKEGDAGGVAGGAEAGLIFMLSTMSLSLGPGPD